MRVTVRDDLFVFSQSSLIVIFGFCFMMSSMVCSRSFIMSFIMSFIVSFIMSLFCFEMSASLIVSSMNSINGVEVPLFPEMLSAS